MKTMTDAVGDLAGIRRAIGSGPFDAVIAVSPENVRYLGDVHISTQTAIRDRLAFIVWPKDAEPVFLVCTIEQAYVRTETWIGDVRGYQEFVTNPVVALAEILRELKLDRGHVALETDYLPARSYNDLIRLLPGMTVSPAEPMLIRARMVKTAKERALLSDAYRSTEKAFLATYGMIRAGDTEKLMAIRLAENILISGADMVAFNHINAGPNTGYPHMLPGDYRVQPGDIVKADSGGTYREYYSNLGRTAKLGPLTDDDRSYWSRLRDIHHTVAGMLRPGNCGRQLFETARALQIKAGMEFPYSHNGHSIGLQIHEAPYINPHDETPYEPGMISTVETRIRWPGKRGYHMEDLYEITEGAPIRHSDVFPNEEIFVI
jgi:Xaa-Pro aminopeptidase